MKTQKHLPLLCLGLLLCWSCSSGSDDEPVPSQPEEKPQINIDTTQSSPVLDQQGGTATVSFTATSAWMADVTAATRAVSWCSVSPTSGNAGNVTLTVTTTANDTYDERRATVTLRSGTVSKSFTVSQKQKDALTVTSNKIELDAAGGEATIEVKANVSYQYDIEESARSWITVADTRGLSTSTLKLNVAENESQEKREGRLTIHSGELSETVTIYQAGAVPTIVLTQNEYTVGSDGETIQVELKSNVDYEVQLPADSWITESNTRALSSHTHYFTVAANDTYDARTAEITFINKENNVAETVKVTQVQRDAIVVAQSEYTVPSEGGSLDFTVNTNVDFTVESSVEWIAQTDTRGLTEKPLHFTVVANTSDEAREGVIILAAGELKQEIRVVQQGKDVFSVSQEEFLVSADGENIQVEVTSNAEYTVQLPGVDWITEVSSRSASSYMHTFQIAANTTYDGRTAEIFFTSTSGITKKVTVTQAQRDAIVVAQSEYTLPAEGGSLDFTVNTNVDFTVESSVAWITQTDTRGLTEKPLHFTVAENTSDDAREGVITLVAGELRQEIRVVQQAKGVFSVSREEFSVGADGENIQVEVTSNGEYTVQLPDVDWVKEISTRGSSSYTHTFQIAANTTYEGRTTEILFTDKASGVVKKVTVMQAQLDAIVVAQNEYTVPAEGGSLDFTVNTNVDFTVESSVAWITQTTTRGLAEKSLHFTVAENTSDDAREGVITLAAGELKQEIRVVQQGKDVFSVSQEEFLVGADGENIHVEVTSNAEYTVQLPGVDWITEVSSRSASSYMHTFQIAANTTYDGRTAEIFFTSTNGITKKVTVTQAQRDAIVVAQNEYTVLAEGGNLDFTVDANVDFTVDISAWWITQTATRGLTEKVLHFTVAENTLVDVREGIITLYSGELKQEIRVIQQAKNIFFVSQEEFLVGADGENIQVEVTCNGEYTVQLPDIDWITEMNTRGAITKIHTFSIAPNNTYDTRSAEITFMDKATGIVKMVKVMQAQLDVLAVAKTEYIVAAIGGNIDVEVSSNVEFTIESSVSWISQVFTRGVTGTTVHFTVEQNTSSDKREGIITFSSGSLKQTIKVIQEDGALGTGSGIDDMPTQEWI